MTINGTAVIKARGEYTDLGFDTLPLVEGSKKPLPRNWNKKDLLRLWQGAPHHSNIGIRAGGYSRVAFMDCDDPRSVQNARIFLAGLGLYPNDYPEVETASHIGRHIYLDFEDDLPGNSHHFTNDFGEGEFKHGSGSMVAAPPSELQDGSNYQFTGGDLRQLPRIRLSDITTILSNIEILEQSKEHPSIPRSAIPLLYGNDDIISRYPTRSEAEQALIMSLYNAGFEFQEILEKFCTFPCAGKFSEIYAKSPHGAISWLALSYGRVVEYASTHESQKRQQLKNIIGWAQSTSWPGRTGAVDQAVFLAHLTIAYSAGRFRYAASTRSLAELSGISTMTASRATRRICATDLIKLDTPAIADTANMYQIESVHIDTLPHVVLKEVYHYAHDAFRRSGLGKSSAEVWAALQDGPKNIKELAMITGRHRTTVKRVLGIMAGLIDTVTGELMPMVEVDGDKWGACESVNLEHIAEIVNTAGMGKRQHEKHEAERRAHRRDLLRGKT